MWRSLLCRWRGHRWAPSIWVTRRGEPVVHYSEKCSCCGEARFVFMPWGTVAEFGDEVTS